MRKIALMVLAVFLMGCADTPEKRAERLIEEYLERNANDPSSVRDLEVGHLIDKNEDPDGKKGKYKYALIGYRAKNGYGALVKAEFVTVCFDEGVTKIICFDCFNRY